MIEFKVLATPLLFGAMAILSLAAHASDGERTSGGEADLLKNFALAQKAAGGDFMDRLTAVTLEKVAIYQSRKVETLSLVQWDERGENLWWAFFGVINAPRMIIDKAQARSGRENFCKRLAAAFTAEHFTLFTFYQSRMAWLLSDKNKAGIQLMLDIHAEMDSAKKAQVAQLFRETAVALKSP